MTGILPARPGWFLTTTGKHQQLPMQLSSLLMDVLCRYLALIALLQTFLIFCPGDLNFGLH